MTATALELRREATVPQPIGFVWLELTAECQLECAHCYAESGPGHGHGDMTTADWKRAIDQALEVGATMVQFIGGEPTLRPDFVELAYYALDTGLDVEVFTNLVKLTPELLRLYDHRRLQLATSYYTSDAIQHAKIVHAPKAYKLTTVHIREVIARGIPLRVGIIDVMDGQRYHEAAEELRAMGVEDIGFDRLRGVGRGVRKSGTEGIKELCGNCTSGVIAISPNGLVWPCVFSRFLPIGNVRITPLPELLVSRKYTDTVARLEKEFVSRTTPAVAHGYGEMPKAIGCTPDLPCLPKVKPGADTTPGETPNMSPCGPWCMPTPDCHPNACEPDRKLGRTAGHRRDNTSAGPCLPEGCRPRDVDPIPPTPLQDDWCMPTLDYKSDVGLMQTTGERMECAPFSTPCKPMQCGPVSPEPASGGPCNPQVCNPNWCMPNPDYKPTVQRQGAKVAFACAPSMPCEPNVCAPDTCVPRAESSFREIVNGLVGVAYDGTACVPPVCAPIDCGPRPNCAPSCIPPDARRRSRAGGMESSTLPTACQPNGIPCQPDMGCQPPCKPYLLAPSVARTA